MPRVLPSLLSVIACTQVLAADRLSPEQLRAIGHQATQALVSAPKPEYPFEARAAHITGSGIFIIVVHANNGQVAAVRVMRSTGYKILDQAAMRAFSQWRFKPGALKPIAETAPWRHDAIARELAKGDVPLKIPCDFTLVAASGAFGSEPDVSAESSSQPKRAAFAPKPEYPLEARQQHLTGSGILVLHIDKTTGTVTSVEVEKSIGHKILDDAAVRAFRQWRFKPGKFTKVKIPIRYTMEGVSDPGGEKYIDSLIPRQSPEALPEVVRVPKR
jgi:TonB family protein